MRRLLVLAAVTLLFSLGAIAETQNPTSGQEETPRPEGSPSASPAASPVTCPEDTSPRRLVNVPNNVTIRLTDEGFDPDAIQTTNNTDMTITLSNTGTRPHSFVMEDFEIRVELAPGEQETLTITPVDADAAVTHQFYSDLPGDECMRGRLIFYI